MSKIAEVVAEAKAKQDLIDTQLVLAEAEVSRLESQSLQIENVVEQLLAAERSLNAIDAMDKEVDLDDTLDTTQVVESTPGGTPTP